MTKSDCFNAACAGASAKFFAFVAAFAVLAPVAFATLSQAAHIVA